VLPRPFQRPHPTIWVGASTSAETFEWAGRHGFHVMVLPYLVPTDSLREMLGAYRDALRAHGHDPATREVFAKFHVFVADSAAEARRVAGPAYERYQQITADRTGFRRDGPVWDDHVADYKVIAGTPADCLERLRHWRDALGITHLGGTFHFGGLDQAATLRSLDLFAREVAPHLRATPAVAGGAPAAPPA
jgi:alkanesulfonate monooxygenase SsuD/methylene tetrahydromethanopterin reductase-like flavin-dependent oxidoreductase (luciferase family)